MKYPQLNQAMGRFVTYAGLVIVSLPLYIYVLWIYSSLKIPDDTIAVQLFTTLLPGFLNHIRTASFVSLLLSLTALGLGIAGISMHARCGRSNTILIVISGIMAFINLFHLF